MAANLSLADQLARKRVHFNGVMNKSCKAGVAYAEVRVNEENGPYKFPCLQQGGHCPLAKFRTAEEVQNKVNEIDGRGMKNILVMLKIKEHFAKTKIRDGRLPCKCGGEIKYAVINGNDHVWARCNTCEISFIE